MTNLFDAWLKAHPDYVSIWNATEGVLRVFQVEESNDTIRGHLLAMVAADTHVEACEQVLRAISKGELAV